MSYYQPEPPHQHGDQPKTGILLVNLGTPDTPAPSALRRYLAQFLTDRRVVEMPRLIWLCILYGFILTTRPKKSAEKYAAIWTKQGSPLLLHVQKQAQLLRGFLSLKIKSPFAIEIGMSYGKPGIQSALDKLRAQHCDRILIFPLYPQYAASTTASALDAVWRVLLKTRNVPAIRTIRHYHDHPAYIAALADSVRHYWRGKDKPAVLVMSFHGLPQIQLFKGDPYYCECHKTARLLAEALELDKDDYMVAFQSRFGKQEWLQPYLFDTLQALGEAGAKRVDVICPGFSSDCLETLEEIAIEGKAVFTRAGGGDYRYIPALNESEAWIHAMADISLENLSGWVSADWDKPLAKKEAEASRLRAQALGAPSSDT